MKWLLDRLRDDSVRTVDVDDASRLAVHGEILSRKKMLRQVFTEFHHVFHKLDESLLSAEGLRIEVGAGVSPMRDSYPDVLATDIVRSDYLDRVLDAEQMDLPDDSVRVFYLQNSFHHFPHPDRFFSELERVVKPGGGAIMLEPYYGPFAGFLFKRLFRTEGYDKHALSWETPVSGPMNGANQAMSYVVFVRDRQVFEEKHPCLKVVRHELAGNYVRYLLSGGLNFRQLFPDACIPFLKRLEFGLIPLNRWVALHHIIVLRKEQA